MRRLRVPRLPSDHEETDMTRSRARASEQQAGCRARARRGVVDLDKSSCARLTLLFAARRLSSTRSRLS